MRRQIASGASREARKTQPARLEKGVLAAVTPGKQKAVYLLLFDENDNQSRMAYRQAQRMADGRSETRAQPLERARSASRETVRQRGERAAVDEQESRQDKQKVRGKADTTPKTGKDEHHHIGTHARVTGLFS